MHAAIIAAAVAALWYWLKSGPAPTFPRVATSNPTPYTSTFPQPGVTGSPTVGNSPSDALGPIGPVTNQPNPSGSGVPAYTALKRGFGTNIPGPTSTLQPFRGDGRDVFFLQSLVRQLQPFDPSPARSGGGCGGCGSSAANGGGCPGPSRRGSRLDGAGSCVTAPSNSAPLTPDRPVLLSKLQAPGVAPVNPMTLAANLNQIVAHSMANAFNAYQWGENLADEKAGGVPAAPTYHM